MFCLIVLFIMVLSLSQHFYFVFRTQMLWSSHQDGDAMRMDDEDNETVNGDVAVPLPCSVPPSPAL